MTSLSPSVLPEAVSPPRSKAPLYWLAFGTFTIGTEGFMIAPLLSGIASDVSVSIATAGQLVTVFALAYAISSPILTTITGSVHRRSLLIASMAAFGVANAVAWSAHSYGALMVARVLIAFAAGLYVPSANALAGALVPPEQRGRALAITNGGTSIAIVLGVPLGAMIGDSMGWRMTFAGVAALAVVATAGLMFGMPRGIGSSLPVATMRERLSVVKQPAILAGLLVTMLWAAGAYTVYTYLAVYLAATAGISGAYVSFALFLWGVSAATGVFAGGNLNDRFGPDRIIVPALSILSLAFASLSVIATWLSPAQAVVPVMLTIVVWGVSAWAFFPSQQTRLIGLAGLKTAPIVLSLNASFMFAGFSAGAAIGSFTLVKGAPADLGWVGASFEVAALLLVVATVRKAARTPVAIAS